MEPQEPRRRWFRFRLRTLLIMVTVLSVLLGWVGWELDQRRREKNAIAWVEEMGGAVYFVSGPFSRSGGPPTQPRTWCEKTKDKWFGERVLWVDLDNTLTTQFGYSAEGRRTTLATLVSDPSALAELKNLKALWLQSNQVSEEQLEELRKALPNCKITVNYHPWQQHFFRPLGQPWASSHPCSAWFLGRQISAKTHTINAAVRKRPFSRRVNRDDV